MSTAASAATLTWDADGNATIGVADGSGDWDTSLLEWSPDGVGGATDVAWNDNGQNGSTLDVAAFGNGGTAGTVTLTTDITAGGLVFNSGVSGSYEIAGTNTLTLGGASPTITSNADATISAIIGGAAPITKAGPGTLTLSGINTFGGGLNITAGTVIANFNNTANLGGGANPLVTVGGAGATLTLIHNDVGFPTTNAAITLNDGATLNLSTTTTTAGYTNALLTQPIDVSGNSTINLTFSSPYGARGTEFELNSTTAANVTLNLVAGGSAANSGSAGWRLYTGELNQSAQLAAGSTLTINGGLAVDGSAASLEFRTGGSAQEQAMLANTDVIFGSDPVSVQTGNGGTNVFQVNSLTGGVATVFATDNVPSTLQINNGTDAGADFAGVIQDGYGAAYSVMKGGTGTQILSGASTYSGTTAINGGTLQIGNGGTTGSLSPNSAITDNATLAFDRTDTVTQGVQFSASPIAGGGGVTLLGGGTLVLTAANTYGGTTAVQNGTVRVASLGYLSTGTLSLGSGATTGQLSYTGSGDSSSRVMDLGGTTGGAVIDSSGTGGLSFTSDFTASGIGSKTLTLQGSYTGANTILGAIVRTIAPEIRPRSRWPARGRGFSAETIPTPAPPPFPAASSISTPRTPPPPSTSPPALTLGGLGSTGGPVTVNDTGIIEAGQNGAGSLTVDGLTFSNTGIINVPGALGQYAGANSPAIIDTGALTANGGSGSIVLNLPAAEVPNGTYRLIGYSGTINGDFSDFMLGTQPPSGGRQTATLMNNPHEIDLVVAGDYPIWTGAASSEWSTNSSVLNWKLATAGTPTYFINGDLTHFNNSATNQVVDISQGDVSPSSAIFDSGNYTLQSTPGIYGIGGSGSLVINGGSLRITNVNSYTGGTTLNGGAIAFVYGGLGFSGNVTFAGSATLQWTSGNTQDLSSQLVMNDGAVATIDTQDNDITFFSGFGGNSSASVVKVGAGSLTLSGVNTFTGGLNVNAGTLAASFATTANLGGGTNPAVTVGGPGSTLSLTHNDVGFPTNNAAITLNDGATLNLSTITLTGGYANALLTQPINVAGNVTINLSFSSPSGSRGTEFELNSTSPANVTMNLAAGGSAANSPSAGWRLYTPELNQPAQLAAGSTLTINGGTTSDGSAAELEFRTGGSAQLEAMLANTDVIFGSDPVSVQTGNFSTANVFQVNSISGGIATVFATDNIPSTLQINNGTTPGADFAGVIQNGYSASYSVVKNGDGTQILSGDSTYTGPTTINSGTLQLGDGGTSGSLSPSSAITVNGTLAFDRSDDLVQGTQFTSAHHRQRRIDPDGRGHAHAQCRQHLRRTNDDPKRHGSRRFAQ